MVRLRIGIILVLACAPMLVLMGLGSYFLWRERLLLAVGWPLLATAIAGYFFAWYWQRKNLLFAPPAFTQPLEWTERDQQAWQLVEEQAAKARQLPPEALALPQTYQQTAQDLALRLAQFYHPKAKDPFAGVTIVELLAVAEFAAHDLAELVERYVPAGHWLTVRQWQQAKKALDWYPTFTHAYWLTSALLRPMETAQRYLASQVGATGPMKMLQDNALGFFYAAYVQRLGTYLIEMNSGRLRVGASRYRELKSRQEGLTETASPAAPAEPLTVVLLGQTGAGKSTLINTLLGEQRARTDVVPSTAGSTRYICPLPEEAGAITLVDTVGYGVAEGGKVKDWIDQAADADLVLVVLHALNAGRQPDALMVKEMESHFAKLPERKRPPILGIVTHIDLLSPALEWLPPYNWQQPERPKEKAIRGAVDAVRQQLGAAIPLVPLALRPDAQEQARLDLLPQIVSKLPEAKAVSLVRSLLNLADQGRARKVAAQLWELGKQALKVWAKTT